MVYDYIIVGSGLAGLNAALNASKKGSVLLVTKKKLANSSSWIAQGGIAAVLAKTDSYKKHIEDTMKTGSYHNNNEAVEFIIRKAPALIRKLIKLGIEFSKDKKGDLALKLEGGHRENRVVHVGDYTGQELEEGLIKAVKARPNIKILESAFAKDLLTREKTCYGIQVIHGKTATNYYGKKTILATGGTGQVYKKTTNPKVATGDGIAMAHRAGAAIKDMEFIQFHPTALDKASDPLFLLSETLRGEGAHLINSKGERFLINHHELAELAPRDIVSQVIYEEEKKGKVYLDLRHIKESYLRKKFPKIIKKLLEFGLNPFKDPMPITAAAHYSCGGITTNLKGETNIKNLYAFGETAHTGLHGANRLASNSLLEALVMSDQIIQAPLPKTFKPPKFPEPRITKQKSTTTTRKEIQKIMWDKVGIIRNEQELAQTIRKLSAMKTKLPKATDQESTKTHNMHTVSLLITKAAHARKKSLGCHFIQN